MDYNSVTVNARSSKNITQTDLDRLDAIFRDLQIQKPELPNLKAIEPPWEKWLQSWKDWINEQINSWLQNIAPGFSVSQETVNQILKAIVIGLAGLILGMILFYLWRYYKTARWFGGKVEPSRQIGPNPAVSSETELDQALQNKRWAMALRLRWGIFLQKKALSRHLTPFETFTQPDYRTFLTKYYSFMFQPQPLENQHYQDWDSWLKQHESDTSKAIGRV